MMTSTMVKPAAVLARTAQPILPFRAARSAVRVSVRAQAQQKSSDVQEQAVKAVALSTLASSFLAAGNAVAATEIADIAAGDNRIGAIALLFAPVIGWVLFNIGGPALNQLRDTAAKSPKQKAKGPSKPRGRGVVGAIGMGAATMLAAQQADAATELAQVAAGDGRIAAIATLFLPVIGWVLFNIGQPALNQLAETASKNSPKAARR